MSPVLKEMKNFCLPQPQLAEVSFLYENKQEQDKFEQNSWEQASCGQQNKKTQSVQLQADKQLQNSQAQDAQLQNKQQNSIIVLTDEALFNACGVRIAFTQRNGGISKNEFSSLNLSSTVGDSPTCVNENRSRLLQALGVESKAIQKRLIVPKQVHKTDMLTIKSLKDISEQEQCVDAVMSLVKDVPVLLCFADCVPIIIVAPNGNFAVAHAGWRGALAGIAQKSLEVLSKNAKAAPNECNIYIGPHIGYCCFETSSDIFQRFVQEYGKSICTDRCFDAEQVAEHNAALNKAHERTHKSHINLSAVVICSLLRAGATKERIKDANKCTLCNNDVYFSYRAQNTHAGRHAAFAIQRSE